MTFRPLYFKEIQQYFNSPAAYVVLVVFLLIAGYLFSTRFFSSTRPAFHLSWTSPRFL